MLKQRNAERGSTVAILAGSMIFMVAMAAIAIDVVVLYVVRGEAQRAADAAALAGAHDFVTSGFTSGTIGQGQLCNGSGTGFAEQAAIQTAAQNTVGGQPGVVLSGDVTCDFSHPGDPLITVKVTRQNLPTFFSRIWGSSFVSSVSATATAEAYNQSGNTQSDSMISSCLKPFLLPNMDPNFPGTGFVFNNDIAHRGPSGDMGKTIQLHPAASFLTPQPGYFYAIIDSGQRLCPGVSSDCTDIPPQNDYEGNIECCNITAFQCGLTYNTDPTVPDPVYRGYTSRGTQCLIHGKDYGTGADQIIVDPLPFQFQAGSHSRVPNVSQGDPIATSESIVTVPIYSGAPIVPAGSSVQVVGFLQLFINSVDATGNITATIMNVVACGPGGAPIIGGGISPIPVRLVQPGNAN